MWQDVLWQLQKLLSPEEALDALDSNTECFHKAGAIVKILLTSKVNCTYVHVHVYMHALLYMHVECHIHMYVATCIRQ